MSAAILTSLLKKLSVWTSRASSSSSAEPPSSAEQELQNLENTLRRIHAILEDAEAKDISDEAERLHLQELKEVAYDAEDVVDEYEYQVLHMKIEARRRAMASHTKVIFDWNSFHPKVSVSDEMARRIRDIMKRFEEINDWNRINLWERASKRRHIKKWKPPERTSYFDQMETFGREEEKNKIIRWLLQEEDSNGDTVSILGIVGMGGLGKTTLTQMVYNDARVREHFSLRGWVYISEDLNVTNLAKKIYESFDECTSVNIMGLDELHEALEVFLDGKMFFLVLDDVWNLKFELCSSLKTILVGVGVGKVLVTTRDERFAKIMQTTPPIYLSPLSFNDSWSLFEKIACEGRDHDFLEIGKKIIHKCRGLPLAIKVVAGILKKEDEEEAWNDVLESELWELDRLENDDIFPVLKMSYDRLPIELRRCFMYLCLFSKDSYIDKSDIVQQWMSHGFIQSQGDKMEEDVGNDICIEFLQRSILQYVSTGPSKDLFSMHDLMHDLAESVAKDEYLLITNPKLHYMIPKAIRHVSIDIKDKNEIINLEPLREAKHLRTLLLSDLDHYRKVEGFDSGISIMDLLPNLRCLRALDLAWWGTHGKLKQTLPDSIGCLKHLRYLDIGCTDSIPESVYNLHFLQTLKSENSMYEIQLSKDIGDLINLRHVYGFDEDHLPREVVGLTNLQTLHHFPVGVESDGMNQCKVQDLKRLPNLKGMLNIHGLETVTWSDVTPPEAYLKSNRGLSLLRLYWDNNADEQVVAAVNETLAARVLDCLQPHRDLSEMSLIGYPGVVLPAWLGHELPALRKLVIEGMERVKSFVLPFQKESEQCHGSEWLCAINPPPAAAAASSWWFPSLEELTLKNMHELEEWREAEGHDLACLCRLFINGCPKLRSFPSLPQLTELRLSRCSSQLLVGCCCLPKLRSLSILSCTGASLVFTSGISMDSLEELSIRSCSELRSVEGLGNLPSLKSLVIVDCPLEELSAMACSGLRSLEGLGRLSSLLQLEIHRCPHLQISPDERLPPSLEHLEISKSPGADEWYQNQLLAISE